MEIDIIKTKIGWIKIKSTNGCIISLKFIEPNTGQTINKDFTSDIKNYLAGKAELRSDFKISGTAFQKQVWKELLKIPYGETSTYSEIAKAIGHPTAYRAVANACGQNKIALYIPCHRVVGKNNSGGYKWGLERKNYLLDIENHCVKSP